MAVRDTFTLLTEGWSDDDRPLSYRFGTSMAGGSPLMVRVRVPIAAEFRSCCCYYC